MGEANKLPPMTASRAEYFMERFKKEEKLLGPNEQAAVDFVIEMLEGSQAVREAVLDSEQWAEYLKEGQTPFERFTQERKDLDALMGLYQKAVRDAAPKDQDATPSKYGSPELQAMIADRLLEKDTQEAK